MGQLAPYLLPVDLPRHLTLHEPGQDVDTVFFPEAGICSIVAAMEDGITIEVGIIGRDGFVGTPAILGADHSPNRCFMQIPGHGFKMKAKILIEQAGASGPLRLSLLRSVQALIVQTAQTAACNRVHELHERLARWLLMCSDRVQSDRLSITHEFLATMLGTRRSSVTVAAATLQKTGLISHARGHVTIENRAGLVDAACECYTVVHKEMFAWDFFKSSATCTSFKVVILTLSCKPKIRRSHSSF
jgi:CRP-like cAMP-binding protein